MAHTSATYASEEEEDEGEVTEEPGERPALGAGELPADFVLRPTIEGSRWANAEDSIEDLLTVEPEEGEEPSGQTIVKVLANKKDIVIGVRCYDEDPGGIVSYSKARDSELDEEDNVMIVLDSFQDGRTGYVFGVNPSGARFDGLVIGREEINSNWDTIWEARTAQDESGWVAVMRIPIKSLGFKKGLKEWGFNVQRRVQRLQETSRWSGASQDFELSQTSRAGLLTDLPEFDYGVGLSVRPAAVGRFEKLSPDDDREYDGDLSLDVSQKLGPNFLGSVTVNTDFAETEVDARQVNLSRFDLFFPEKRAFFLEGTDIFEFGVGLDEEVLLPFFSRNIGLVGVNKDEDQVEIPINVGGKINGRAGNTNLGGLVVNTRKQERVELEEDSFHEVPQSTMGAVRLKQNIFEESSFGVISTFGDAGRLVEGEEEKSFEQDSGAWMAGADFTYQTSSFLNEKNFIMGVWGLVNDREDLGGDKSAYGFEIDYPNDLVDLAVKSIRIGDGFEPSLGFVPRNDIHLWEFIGEVNPRPSWSWLRQMGHEAGLLVYNDWDNSDWESYQATVKPFDWLFESGDQLSFSIEPEGDRLFPARGGGEPEPFEISGGVDIRPDTYEWVRYVAGARSAEKRKLSAEFLWEFGDFYNGDLTTLEGRLSLRPSAFLTLELTGERNTGSVTALPDDYEEVLEELAEEDPEVSIDDLDLVKKEFTEELIGFRVQFNFTPEVQLSSFTQYQFDNEVKELGTNNRLRWTFDRLGDLFVVYNHNWERSDRSWNFVSNELPIKVQYNWRF